MNLDIIVYQDLWDEDDDGKPFLVKENIRIKRRINADHVSVISEVINKKGVPYKDRCGIHHVDLGSMVVKGKYDEVKSIIDDKTKGKEIGGFVGRRLSTK